MKYFLRVQHDLWPDPPVYGPFDTKEKAEAYEPKLPYVPDERIVEFLPYVVREGKVYIFDEVITP